LVISTLREVTFVCARRLFADVFRRFRGGVSGMAPATVDSTSTRVIQANIPGGIFAIRMRCCAKILELSSSNQIEKDQCEKLQKFILNLETAEKVDELLELMIAR